MYYPFGSRVELSTIIYCLFVIVLIFMESFVFCRIPPVLSREYVGSTSSLIILDRDLYYRCKSIYLPVMLDIGFRVIYYAALTISLLSFMSTHLISTLEHSIFKVAESQSVCIYNIQSHTG